VCWQCVAVCCRVLQCVAVCCSVLQCVAVRCSALHGVAACCSALLWSNFMRFPPTMIWLTEMSAEREKVINCVRILMQDSWFCTSRFLRTFHPYESNLTCCFTMCLSGHNALQHTSDVRCKTLALHHTVTHPLSTHRTATHGWRKVHTISTLEFCNAQQHTTPHCNIDTATQFNTLMTQGEESRFLQKLLLKSLVAYLQSYGLAKTHTIPSLIGHFVQMSHES